MPIQVVSDQAAIESLRGTILRSAERAVTSLRQLVEEPRPIDALAKMKFADLGRHPLENRALNLVEQVNQTFTYLVSLVAASEILLAHPGSAPIRLNLGTSSGSDLESASGSVAAEIFAAVRATNNRKLVKDVAKVAETDANHKYVFFFSPGEEARRFRLESFPGVEVVALSADDVWGPFPARA
jgi:hypothetical protein